MSQLLGPLSWSRRSDSGEHVISELSCDVYVMMRCWLVVIVRLLWRSFMSSSRLLCTEIGGCVVGGVGWKYQHTADSSRTITSSIITSFSGFSPFRFEIHLDSNFHNLSFHFKTSHTHIGSEKYEVMASRRIKYYFDVISPYTAFSWQVLRRYSKRWKDQRVELELVPVSFHE